MRAGGEHVAVGHGEAGGWDDALETHSYGGVEAEAFFDAGGEVGEVLALLPGDWITQVRGVEFLKEDGFFGGRSEEVVEDGC